MRTPHRGPLSSGRARRHARLEAVALVAIIVCASLVTAALLAACVALLWLY